MVKASDNSIGYADYDLILIGDKASDYTITLSGFSNTGGAGNAFEHSHWQNGRPFSA